MAETPEKSKSLEMRVAELEDKLSKMHISEDEMKTYQKVASILGGGAMGAQPSAPTAQALPQYSIYQPYYQPCYWYRPYYRPYYQADCIPMQQGPMMPMGGGFGSFGH